MFSFTSLPRFFKAVATVFSVATFFFADSAYALTWSGNGVPDLGTMLINLSQDLPAIMRLVTAVGYVMGFFFVVKGVMELKHMGESRTMMSSEHGMMAPIMYLVAGALLIYLPSTVQVGLSTFWTSPNPYGYVQQGTDNWSQLINAIFTIIQLIGVISLIRGIIMLTRLGGRGGQHGEFAKALTHMIAGILCINMFQFLNSVFATLGLGQLS